MRPHCPLSSLSLDLHAFERGLDNETCLQCGQQPADVNVERTFRYQPWWLVLLFILSAGILLLVGRTLLPEEDSTIGRFRLCARCKRSITWAEGLRSLAQVGVMLAPLLVILAALFFEPDLDSKQALGALAAGLVLGLLIWRTVARRTRARVISCRRIRGTEIVLRVSASWRAVLDAEQNPALRRAPASGDR